MRANPAQQVLSALQWLPFVSPNRQKFLRTFLQRGAESKAGMEWLNSDALILSSLIKPDSHCESLEGIVSGLGPWSFGSLALRARMQHVPPHALTWSASRFLRHSSVTADSAQHLVRILQQEKASAAYLGGLFHDIGTALLAISMPAMYDDIQGVSRLTHREVHNIEHEIFGFDHAGLSAMVLRQWNLPASLCDSVQFHHAPADAPEDARQLSYVLKEADDYFTSKSIACIASDSFSLANLSVTSTCKTYSPGANLVPSESCPPV